MFLVGLTGGIATGKSLVAKIFEENGIYVVDADIIAKQVVESGQPAYKKIVKSFGTEILNEQGEIDRKKLGNEIFSSSEKRKLLNSLTHPWIYGSMRKQIFKCFLKGEQFVVLDLPLLYETRSVLSYLYKTIVVSCDADVQFDRLMSRNHLSQTEAKQRIESQMPLETKADMADIVIDNSGSILFTREQIDGVIRLLRSSKRHIRNRVILGASLLLIVGVIFLIIYWLFFR